MIQHSIHYLSVDHIKNPQSEQALTVLFPSTFFMIGLISTSNLH